VTADDKKKVRQRIIHDIFIRYGGGAQHVQRITTLKCWNWLAWVLIGIGTVCWIVFLLWNP
jgi:hypothetical protein